MTNAASGSSVNLITPVQQEVETVAERLVATPLVQHQIQESLQHFLLHAAANSPDGKNTAQNALQELAYATAVSVAGDSPANPKVMWTFLAPRSIHGKTVHGTRWGGDNPDNIYRSVILDGASKYTMTIRVTEPGPIDFSFQVYDSVLGENTKMSALLDTPIAGLRKAEMVRDTDGLYRASIDSAPANGRPNHIQTNPDTRIMLIRNTLNDWKTQHPVAVDLQRVDGPPPAPPPSLEIMAQKTADLLKIATDADLALVTVLGNKKSSEPNVLTLPVTRGGGWGYVSFGRYQFAEDEALVLTVDRMSAAYNGLDLLDPWSVSRDHIHTSASLNNGFAETNRDGSYTWVISAKDPGVLNWADTGGLHHGLMVVRWQVQPETHATPDTAIRSFKVVKLIDLDQALPADATRVTPAKRRQLITERTAAYARRYTE